MSRINTSEKPGLIQVLFIFFVSLVIGLFLGVALVVFMFTALSMFFGAISTLLGTILVLALLFIILFSYRWLPLVRIAFFGIIVGVIISVILEHTFTTALVGGIPNNVVCWIFLILVSVMIIFGIIYFFIARYTIVKKKNLVMFHDKDGEYQNKKKKRK